LNNKGYLDFMKTWLNLSIRISNTFKLLKSLNSQGWTRTWSQSTLMEGSTMINRLKTGEINWWENISQAKIVFIKLNNFKNHRFHISLTSMWTTSIYKEGSHMILSAQNSKTNLIISIALKSRSATSKLPIWWHLNNQTCLITVGRTLIPINFRSFEMGEIKEKEPMVIEWNI
jgi:hypothetical protein